MFPQEQEKHIVHYFVLFAGLVAFAGSFFLFSHQPTTQIFILFACGVFYAAWGIIHHWLENRLNNYIIIEYLLIAALVVLLSFYLLFI